jgi:Fe2+ transport system protein B
MNDYPEYLQFTNFMKSRNRVNFLDLEHYLATEKKLKKLNPGIPVVHFSAVTGAGISELKDAIWGQLHSGN